jgi:hypothetical protein
MRACSEWEIAPTTERASIAHTLAAVNPLFFDSPPARPYNGRVSRPSLTGGHSMTTDTAYRYGS